LYIGRIATADRGEVGWVVLSIDGVKQASRRCGCEDSRGESQQGESDRGLHGVKTDRRKYREIRKGLDAWRKLSAVFEGRRKWFRARTTPKKVKREVEKE
jgi:hypothetical protein